MIADFGELIDALRARMAVVWAETILNGIYEGEQAALVPWSELTPPFAAIITPMEAGQGVTLDTQMRDFRMDIYYLGATRGSSKPIYTALKALGEDLETADLDAGRILDIGLPSCSRSLPGNASLTQTGESYRVGRLPLLVRL